MTNTPNTLRELVEAREQNKLQLLKLEAKKVLRQHRFFAFQENTSVADRLELAAEIAELERVKQEQKIAILALKQAAKDKRTRGLVARLTDKLNELGYADAVEDIRKEVEADMTEAENDAYKARI